MPTSLTPSGKAVSKKRPGTQKLSIREQIYRQLRDKMQKGEISYEDRLVDHEIAAAQSVSRMPVREALLQLKNEGFIEGTSRGFILRRFTPADIAHLFEVRLLLEPPAAVAACNNASLEGLAQMRIATATAEQAHRDDNIVLYMEANGQFRSTWVSMVPNPHLANMIDRLRDHVEAVRLATLREKQYREWSIISTQKILDGFLRRDAEAVRESTLYNLRMAATSYYAKQDSLLADKNKT